MCGTVFNEIADLKLHVEKRHEKPKDQVEMMKTLDVKHFMTILREENLDLFEEIRSLKKSMVQGLHDIRSGQDVLRDEFQQMANDFGQLEGSSFPTLVNILRFQILIFVCARKVC